MKHIPIFVFAVFAVFTPAAIAEEKPVTIIKENTSKSLSIDIDENLNNLRNVLIGTGFISDDSHRNKWRFVLPSPNANEVLITEDEVVGKKSERVVKIKECLNTEDEIHISNVDAKPDLVGVETDSFSDRQIDVSVELNSKHSQDKFQPLMLKHVREDGKTYSTYDNVVVCEEDSVIQFGIVAKGVSGFGFSIKPDAGDYIVEQLYVNDDDYDGSNTGTTVRRYQYKDQNIKIVSGEAPEIPLSESVNRQHITITLWKLISYTEGGKSISTKFTTNSLTTSAAVARDITVSADDYQMGQAVPDGHADETFDGITDVNEDTSHVLGRIEIDFFIFNSKEAARKVFGARQ